VSTTRSQLYRLARDLGNVEAVEHGYKRGGLSGAPQEERRRVRLGALSLAMESSDQPLRACPRSWPYAPLIRATQLEAPGWGQCSTP